MAAQAAAPLFCFVQIDMDKKKETHMTLFPAFYRMVADAFQKMVADNTNLFVADVNPDDLWVKYLASFPPGTDPIFKTRIAALET